MKGKTMQQDIIDRVPGMTINGPYILGLLLFSVLVVRYAKKVPRK
jgi:hypothetical protein